MNNRFKFRAWDKQRKMMVTDFVLAPTSPTWSAHIIRETSPELGNLITEYYKSKGDFLACDSYTVLDWSDYYGIDNYEIMQFTGIQDMDGNDIYEGDVIEYDYYDWYTQKTKRKISQVIYDEGMFCAQEEESFPGIYTLEKIKRISNIYQNPELLDERE